MKVPNAADPDNVEEQQALEKLRLENERKDLGVVLSTKSGRRTLWRWLALCGIYRCSLASSPEATAFNEGRREIGLRLLSEIETHWPRRYLQMVSESTLLRDASPDP